MSINLEDNCIKELLKNEENKQKNSDSIIEYLKSLKVFNYLLKYQSSANYEKTIKELSKILKLQKINKNELIYQQGDIGKHFYIILNGHFKILILRPYEFYMSEEEYILFLLELRLNNQKEIIQQSDHFNSLIFPIPYDTFDELVKDLAEKKTKGGIYLDSQKAIKKAKEVYDKIINEKKDNSELNKEKSKIISSPEEYIKKHKVSDNIVYNTVLINNLINNSNLEDKSEEDLKKIKLMMKDRKKLIIPVYEIFSELETGAFFGDSGLENSNGAQEYSIISVKDESHLVYIDKAEYNSLIHSLIEKRNFNIFNIILYFSLYRPINQSLFEKKYLNFFRDKVFNVNNILFNEGDECNEMYFITDGEYELSVNKNIIEVNKMIIKYKEILKKLNKNNKINSNYLNISEEIKQNNSLILNQKFRTYIANKLIMDRKYIKLNILNKKDIIGLADVFLYNNENETVIKDNDNSNFNKPTVIYGEQVKKKCLVTCKCITSDCHAFSLNNNIFNNLYYNEGNYNIATKNLEIKKIFSIIDRLNNHKEYIFELVNKEQNKFSKKIKKIKFFTKNPKLKKKGNLPPDKYHNILNDIKTSLEQKEKLINDNIRRQRRASLNFKSIPQISKVRDKFDFSKQYFSSSTGKSKIVNQYSLNLQLMKKLQNKNKEKNETIYTIYNKDSDDKSQNNLTKSLIRDFLYEKFFYKYAFNDLNYYNNYLKNNLIKDNYYKSINEHNLNTYYNNSIKTEDTTQKEFLKSLSCDKTKKTINIRNINNTTNNKNFPSVNNSLCQTNFNEKPGVLKSNFFSIDGKMLEEKYKYSNKIVNTVSISGKSKIRLTKTKSNKVYDPLAFEKFNKFFNITFRKQYIDPNLNNY